MFLLIKFVLIKKKSVFLFKSAIRVDPVRHFVPAFPGSEKSGLLRNRFYGGRSQGNEYLEQITFCLAPSCPCNSNQLYISD